MNLALGPLLQKIVHVNSVDLVGPKVSLLTDAGGKDNYTFTAAASGPSTPAPAAAGTNSGSVTLDQIDSINLTNAEVLVVVARNCRADRRHQRHQIFRCTISPSLPGTCMTGRRNQTLPAWF